MIVGCNPIVGEKLVIKIQYDVFFLDFNVKRIGWFYVYVYNTEINKLILIEEGHYTN